MLGKLLKYDLKWIMKLLIIFYVLALSFAVIGRGLVEIENSPIFNVIGQVFIGASISMMFSVLINTLMRVWVRFIRNSYKDESYLTHTLPVSKKTIYLAKILSAIISMITSGIVILASLAICYYSEANIEFIKSAVEMMATSYNSTVVGFILTLFIILVLEAIFALLAGYMGIILGHRANNKRMLKSVIYGFAVFMIPSIITLIILFVIGLFNPEVMNLFFSNNSMPELNVIKTVLYAGIALYVAYIAIYYVISTKLFEKGVNVE